MKNTRTLLTRPALRGLVLALAVTALSSYVSRAVPYASGISNSGNTVYFILNQDAQGVTVLRDGANPVSPGTTKGQHSFDMTGYSSYQIIVTGNTASVWTQISDDSLTQSKYYSPRGVFVDTNPKRTTFGQIIVAEALGGAVAAGGRTTTDGLYIMSADQGDVHGQGNTAYGGTINWTTGGSSSPYHISMNRADPAGQDYTIYIADWSDGHSGIWTADALNPSTAFNELLDNTGRAGSGIVLAGGGVGPDQLHGSVSAGPWVEGTGASRVMFTLDEDVLLGNVLQYDIGTTTSGYTTAPLNRVSDTPNYIANGLTDLVRDEDGSWWLAQYRFTDSSSVPSLSHWPDNSAAPVWTSGASTVQLNLAYGSIDIDDRDNLLVMGTVGGGIYVLGISDPNAPVLLNTIASGTDTIRDVSFDAAGNIYAVNNSTEKLRIYSPGGYTVATTSSDGTFDLFRPVINVSVTASPDTTSMDLTQPPGVFTITRTGDTSGTLAVNYTLSGTATNGTHYQSIPTTVTFDVNASSTNINVVAIPVTPAGPTRSVVLTLNGSGSYTPYPPSQATVWIVDTNAPAIHIATVSGRGQFYERTNDYAPFRLTRYGNTNAYLGQVNVTYGGTATAGTQFYGQSSVTFNIGDVTSDVLVYPIHDGAVTGPLTVNATVAPASFGEYVVGTPATSGDVTRMDSDDPPETVLWSDNLQTDTSANWTYYFAITNGGLDDYWINTTTAGPGANVGTWPYDYSALVIPPAPHSGGDTHGLYMTVNKNDSIPAAAALNFYPNGQSFSGNYAFRFDMCLIRNNGAATTEYALFGINHSGTKTNWFRNSTTDFAGVDPVAWDFDGIFYDVEADGAALGDYVGYSSPTTAGRNPTPITPGVNASSLTATFRAPPWVAAGVAANTYANGTNIWADVEIAQINGVIYWSINHTLIFAYTNTTPYTSGTPMLGYADAYDSVGGGGGAVIYANARVVSLAGPTITSIVQNGANVEIIFSANASDTTSQFTLQQSTPAVTGAYSDTSSTITSLGGGLFKSVKAMGAGQTFYRIRRIY